jgi:hypothetical protein
VHIGKIVPAAQPSTFLVNDILDPEPDKLYACLNNFTLFNPPTTGTMFAISVEQINLTTLFTPATSAPVTA